MNGASRFGFAGICILLSVSCAAAADLTAPAEPPPPPAPTIYVHGGLIGSWANANASPTGGGLFRTQETVGGGLFVGQTNDAISPAYTVVLETGYFVTPNFAIALGTAVPPVTHFKATGLALAPLLGTDLLGSARYGEITVLFQYHFDQFGPFQPYVGFGPAYALNFGNISDGLLRNFYWDQNFAFVLQAGADYMLTPNWGVFADGKKVFFSTDSGGFAPTTLGILVPTRANVRVDPWAASAGITFKY
jgi:outer membrane protein